MTQDGSRRRTRGGVYFFLIKQQATPEQRKLIFTHSKMKMFLLSGERVVEAGHISARLIQRYNISLTPEIYAEILVQIQGSSSTFVGPAAEEADKKSVHRITITDGQGKKEVFVLYDETNESLITALTPSSNLKRIKTCG